MKRKDYLARAEEFALRGSQLPHAKLDDDKVRIIRANREGLTQAQLAERLGVSKRAIQKVAYFESWCHVV